MKIIAIVLVVLFVGSLFLHKFLEKSLNKSQMTIVRTIAIVIMVGAIIFTILTLFTGFSLEGKTYGWATDYMNYSKLHTYSTGKSQKIALIDSGVSGFQSVNSKSTSLVGDSKDNIGHGTRMYSVIKGYEDKIQGIAPEADILSIKVVEADEKLDPDRLSKAIKYAISEKCTIINLSMGSFIPNQKVSDDIKLALSQGITVVASSGDYEKKDMMFPASEDGVISVGSLSANKKVSHITNAPAECVIIAPGDEIKTINNKNIIASTSGTSEATAIISGYLALLRDYYSAKNISLNNDKIKDILASINSKKSSYVDPFN